ncbi:MAG TPA: hypothetical protein VFE16_10310 [Candidatus Cybelea sp.]|jgi:hypothetical protein|nr:hypothetical protein [Candidatus Cybelea sp.]
MTGNDFLTSWAAKPDSEMFFGVKHGERPYEVMRIEAGDRASLFERLASHPNFASHARVASIKGVICLMIEGEVAAPWKEPFQIINIVPSSNH